MDANTKGEMQMDASIETKIKISLDQKEAENLRALLSYKTNLIGNTESLRKKLWEVLDGFVSEHYKTF